MNTQRNDTFDFGRFGHELRHYFMIKRKELTLLSVSAIVITAFFTVANFFAPARNIDVWNFTIIFYFIILCLCVSVGARAFSNLNTLNGMLTELTTPASQLEKFLTRWLLTVPLPLAFCLVLMKVIEKVGIYTMIISYGEKWPDLIPFYIDPLALSGSWIIALVWFQAIFFCASAAWRKHSSLKTIASLTVAAILAICIWGNYMPFLHIASHRTAMIISLVAVPLGYYVAAWMLYRRAQVK